MRTYTITEDIVAFYAYVASAFMQAFIHPTYELITQRCNEDLEENKEN